MHTLEIISDRNSITDGEECHEAAASEGSCELQNFVVQVTQDSAVGMATELLDSF